MTDFNLWRDPWIRALDEHGSRVELGISDLLARAHELRALYDPSPLTVAGTHRLLTAVLQAIYDPWELAEIADVLAAGRFDRTKLDFFGAQHGARFGLFDPAAPFMQTSDAPAVLEKAARKTVAYLMPEVPSGINRIHFNHAVEQDHSVCAACCGRLLVTIPPFATAGGRPYRPSINGTPPIYVFPVADTLTQSLALSIIAPEYQPKVADVTRREISSWNCPSIVSRCGELSEVGYIEGLTFPSRRIRLYPDSEGGYCTRCGSESNLLVSDIFFDMGLSRKKEAELWKDPFVAYYRVDNQPRGVKPSKGRAIWREYAALFLASEDLPPSVILQLQGLVDDRVLSYDQLLRFRCIGIRTDQAKSIEWFDDTLDVPSRLLIDPAGGDLIREALNRAEDLSDLLFKVLRNSFKPNGGKRTWFNTLRERMQADYWARLARPFHEMVGTVAPASDYPALARGWAALILTTAEQTAQAALEQIGDQAELLRRRVLAEDWLRKELNKRRKEWMND